MDQATAIDKAVKIAIKETNDANELLIYITLGAIGILLYVFTRIWNRGIEMQEKRNTLQEQKHKEHEDIMKQLADNQGEVNILLAQMTEQMKHHTERLDDHKDELKILRVVKSTRP